MVNFYSGVAGAHGRNPQGIVIHNDAGSQAANAAFYRNWLPSHNAVNGFAHYYVASDGTYQAENEANMAWHTANANGNANYIGIEACQSLGNATVFQANEQKCFKLAAEILKRYGLKANATTVKLHREFVATSCPHRSWELHNKAIEAVRSYFISEINKYMGNSSSASPNNTVDGTASGAGNPIKSDGSRSKAHLDRFGEKQKGKLYVAGWHVGNYNYQYVFIMDKGTGKELARIAAPGIARSDVNKALSTSGKVGFDVHFDISRFKGKTVYVMSRCTNDSKGNTAGGHSDIHFSEWFLKIQ